MKFWYKLFIDGIKKFPFGSIEIELPNGVIENIKGNSKGPHAFLKINDSLVFKEIIQGGSVKFAELFMSQRLSSIKLTDLMHYFAMNNDQAESTFKISIFKYILNKISHLKNKNTKIQSKKNISYHYDLGNDFYKFWLDKTMTYSSAIFSNKSENLEEAQLRKYSKLANLASIKKNDKVLEIGCGWGGLSQFLAENYDCDVTAITISKEQFNYATERIKKAKLNKKVKIIYCDYRNIEGKFDKILSIEMFEAVGKDYWNTFFKKVQSILNPNGIIGLQLITIDNKIYDVYSKNPDFIQKYIFPGGMLPSEKILKSLFTKHSLTLEGNYSYADDYAKTLSIWNKNFNENWEKIEKLGFDKRFKLMWNYYLSYCEGGFLSKNIDLKQIKLKFNQP
ncbi:cyclopropane-fatty-acyl-phospholipid synthase family protein [Alphaproteobacteria bacterium]|nr:cyclopropane-fatty-acyl-phospholipid synthase family protein [Alphaproteobacteria bacterium]